MLMIMAGNGCQMSELSDPLKRQFKASFFIWVIVILSVQYIHGRICICQYVHEDLTEICFRSHQKAPLPWACHNDNRKCNFPAAIESYSLAATAMIPDSTRTAPKANSGFGTS
jgi:hypothetical protein